jgi:hypothetical protein
MPPVPTSIPKLPYLSLNLSLPLSLSLLSLLSILYMTRTLLFFLPILLTIVLGLGLGAITPSKWTQAPQSIVTRLFLPNSHIALGPDLWVIYMPLTAHCSVTPCRALRWFHSTHSTPDLISTGTGKIWPLRPAPCGTSVCESLAILVFGIPISPCHLPAIWPLASPAPN